MNRVIQSIADLKMSLKAMFGLHEPIKEIVLSEDAYLALISDLIRTGYIPEEMEIDSMEIYGTKVSRFKEN